MFGKRKKKAQTKRRGNANEAGPERIDGRPARRRRAATTVGAPLGAAAVVAGRQLNGSAGNSLTHSASNALAHHAADGVSTEAAAAAVGVGAAAVAGTSAGAGAGAVAAGASGSAATAGASAAGVAAAGSGAASGGAGAGAGAAAAGQSAQTIAIGAVGVAAVATVVVVVATTGDETETAEPEPTTTTAPAPAPAAPAPTPGPGVFETTATGALGADLFSGVDQETEVGPLMVAGLMGEPTNVGVPIVLASGATLTVDPQGNFRYEPDETFAALSAGETIVDEFTYTVTNADGFVEEWTAAVTVVGENDAPTMAEASGPTVEEGATSSVAVSATDPDGDPLVFSLADDAPAFASLVDAGDGTATVALAPPDGTAGTHEVVVTVSDGGQPPLTDSTTITVTVEASAEEPPAPARVTEQLVALYGFGEGSGASVSDSSGASAPALTVADPDAVTWGGGALTIDSPTIVRTDGGSAGLVGAITASNEFTVEAWVTAANATQSGPARIVSISDGTGTRNVTLSQGRIGGVDGDRWTSRQRSTGTSTNGLPDLAAPAGSVVEGRLTHLVLTRSAGGDVQLYVDGAVVASGSAVGDLSNWDGSLPLTFANETSMDRPWLGSLHLVAIYSRALSSDEVDQNRQVGV